MYSVTVVGCQLISLNVSLIKSVGVPKERTSSLSVILLIIIRPLWKRIQMN